MLLLLLFIGIPLLEITLFIQVGGAIGLGWTLFIVVATAILGAYMVRSQGTQAMTNLRGSFSNLQDPTEHLAHGAMILFSGALLLTPGFFTDFIGFSLLVPAVRSAVYGYMRSRVNVQSFQMGPDVGQNRSRTGDHVIDGEFEQVDPENSEPRGPSGWTKD
ncbi:FxsA family protein [Octadecabacter sp. 1_MG-2023]|uniref:FxsA family protein n=1 Tax=unclassified Octadecabacter TaxID=196158 RepID=UPI001C09B1F9|nr:MULTISPECIES: FxsA family protein [unclassified Octadecabacter]MBU2992319.1 FxsA family protein [Octadecabacter sp. B2R22]MDO6734924.1 FxsA family protein [Octadecabacter sp. 1_MG-2023]